MEDNNLDFYTALSILSLQQQRQKMGNGGFLNNLGAGVTGALQGVAGSLLPGQLGNAAVQGIGAVHGMIDKDVTDSDKAIMAGGRAVGAAGTAIATGGASLASGADDIAMGTVGALQGTEFGEKNSDVLNTVGNVAGVFGATPAKYGGRYKMEMGGSAMTAIENGGTHEQNPLGGSPLGQNASVEQGEMVRHNSDSEKFVYSEKLKDGKVSFAKRAKAIEKKYIDRKGDAAATRAKNQELDALANKQETLKASKVAKLQSRMDDLVGAPQPGQLPMAEYGGRYQMQHGGSHNTGRAAKGFNLPQGLDVSMIDNFQQYALNQGANLGKFGVDSIYGKNTDAAWKQYGQKFLNNSNNPVSAGSLTPAGTSAGTVAAPTTPSAPITTAAGTAASKMGTVDPSTLTGAERYNYDLAEATRMGNARQEADAQSKHVLNRNLSIGTGALLNSAGDIYNLVQGMRGPEDINLSRLDPEEVNLAKQREMAKRNMAGSQASLREGMRRSGNISDFITGTAALDQNLANQLTGSMLEEETRNVGIRNAAQQANQAIDTQEQILNLQAQSKSQEAIQAGLSGIGGNAAGAFKDIRMSDQVDTRNTQQLNAMNAILKDFVMNKEGQITFQDGTVATQQDIADYMSGKKK